jgi:hypothetical protein
MEDVAMMTGRQCQQWMNYSWKVSPMTVYSFGVVSPTVILPTVHQF